MKILRGVCIILGIALALISELQCGDPPTNPPEPQTGSIRVTALDTTSIDSIDIELDDLKVGRLKNPAILNNVAEGTHKVRVYDEVNAPSDTIVGVSANHITEVSARLFAEGPYVGRIAPAFTARTIDDSVVVLSQLRGKVVFLIFFEHT